MSVSNVVEQGDVQMSFYGSVYEMICFFLADMKSYPLRVSKHLFASIQKKIQHHSNLS